MRLLPHIAAKIINTPLAIQAGKLEAILGIVGDRIQLDPESIKPSAAGPDLRGRDRKSYAVTEDGIVTIPVQGTLLKKTFGLFAASGMGSYQGIQQQIAQCLEDSSVRGILLDIDSPGGETAGCFELCDYIYNGRDQKPIYACANDVAASAAYAVGSSASKLWMTRMGAVGSVGVYCLHSDQSGLDENVGIKFEYIFAGDRKIDGNEHEPLSRAARKGFQGEVDRQYSIFVQTVARNRGIDAKEVAGTEAAVLYPDKAVPLLADAVGTLEDAYEALRAQITGIPAGASITKQIRGTGELPDLKGLAAIAANSEAKEQSMPKTDAAIVGKGKPKDDEMEEKGEAMGPEECEDEADKKGKKAKAVSAKKSEPDDEEEDDNEEDDKPSGKKATASVRGLSAVDPGRSSTGYTGAQMEQIGMLCKIAGKGEIAFDLIAKKMSVADVQKHLVNLRAEESAKTAPSGRTGLLTPKPLASMEAAGKQYSKDNRGVTKEQAFAKALEDNPEMYTAYKEEKRTDFGRP